MRRTRACRCDGTPAASDERPYRADEHQLAMTDVTPDPPPEPGLDEPDGSEAPEDGDAPASRPPRPQPPTPWTAGAAIDRDRGIA